MWMRASVGCSPVRPRGVRVRGPPPPSTQALLYANTGTWALTLELVTVGHFTLPVAGLFFEIES